MVRKIQKPEFIAMIIIYLPYCTIEFIAFWRLLIALSWFEYVVLDHVIFFPVTEVLPFKLPLSIQICNGKFTTPDQ